MRGKERKILKISFMVFMGFDFFIVIKVELITDIFELLKLEKIIIKEKKFEIFIN